MRGLKAIQLGDKVKDRVTGYEGTAVGYSEYLNGCVRVMVQSPVNDKGEIPTVEWIDEGQVFVTELRAETVQPAAEVGGPMEAPPAW